MSMSFYKACMMVIGNNNLKRFHRTLDAINWRKIVCSTHTPQLAMQYTKTYPHAKALIWDMNAHIDHNTICGGAIHHAPPKQLLKGT